MADQELEDIKTKIDLRSYAASQGYELKPKDSWRGSSCMRRGGDKLFIKVDGDGHWVYFNVNDEKDNGSIIDFVQRRKRINIGWVKKELRPLLGKRARPLPEFPALPRTPTDRLLVESQYARMEDALRHP